MGLTPAVRSGTAPGMVSTPNPRDVRMDVSRSSPKSFAKNIGDPGRTGINGKFHRFGHVVRLYSSHGLRTGIQFQNQFIDTEQGLLKLLAVQTLFISLGRVGTQTEPGAGASDFRSRSSLPPQS